MQVGAHCAVGQVEALADLAVGQTVGRKLGDVQLVRGQLVAGVRTAPRAALACRAQLVAGTFAPRDDAERVEGLTGRTQVWSRVRRPTLSPQPLAVRELCPRTLERPARGCRAQRLLVQLLRLVAGGEHCARVAKTHGEGVG